MALACLLVAALAIAGCGEAGKAETPAAPAAADFPSAQGKTIDELLEGSGVTEDVVVAPAAQSFEVGVDRYPFGVFDLGGEPIEDAEVALYFAKTATSPVQGPLPAETISLETKPAYRAAAAGDVTVAYAVPAVDFDREGPWLAIAMLRGPDGPRAVRVPSPEVGVYPRIPGVGEKAPAVHTPTAEDVGGDLAKIDTRTPPSQLHEVDFADVVGEKPAVLIFATPAFCTSRVCGPIVDIAQQVADQYKGEVEFIHVEVYEENNPNKPIRPQLKAFGLRTEPWIFLVDEDGVVRERVEGPIGVAELDEAVQSILQAEQPGSR